MRKALSTIFLIVLLAIPLLAENVEEPKTWTGVIYLLGVLFLSQAGQWVRELSKHRTWKKNNGTMDKIKSTTDSMNQKIQTVNDKVDISHSKIDCLDRKVDENKTETTKLAVMMGEVKTNCHITTSRFEKAIKENQSLYIDLLKESKK